MPLESDLRPGEPWVFDGDVAANFDDMLARSIPGYADMRELTTTVAASFLGNGGDVVDLGASRGEALAHLLARVNVRRAWAVESSQPMLEVLAARRWPDGSHVSVVNHDLRRTIPLPFNATTVALSVLTLQFLPIEYRLPLLADVYSLLRPGGALLLVEKTLGGTPDSAARFAGLYRELKARAGYSYDEIDRKAAALEGVLVPVTAAWNESLLDAAGFRDVECYWRSLNFAAWVGVRR